MNDKNSLTGAIVDCLNALALDSDTRADVQDTLLSKVISGGISSKVLPVLMTVSFLKKLNVFNLTKNLL